VHVQARRLGRVLRRRRRAFGAPPARFTDGPLAGLTLELPPRHAENFREYEPAMARALIRLAQPGNVCADVGAHFGYFTYALARRVDRLGRVVAFEAAAENARVIEHNVRRNALGNRVEVVHAAVADRHGERLKLFAGRNGGSMEWTLSGEFARRGGLDDQELPETQVVPCVTLDEYFSPAARLDVVKIDIEGGEGRALAGMRGLLAQARPIIVLEFHREVGWPAIPILLDSGYELQDLGGRALAIPQSADEVPYQLIAWPIGRRHAATS